MYWRAFRGTGLTIHDIRPIVDGRVEFTVWLSLFWIPLVPVSSWLALYIGERPSDDVFDDSAKFADLVRLPFEWSGIVQTFARVLLRLAIAIAPAAYLIFRVQGRVANRIEVVFVFASALWPVLIIIWSENHGKSKLRKSY